MTLKEAIEMAKKYFENRDIPKTTREWRTNCPPELTAGKINSLEFSVGDVLRAINPKARQARKPKVTYDKEALGFSDLVIQGNSATYVCSCCGKEKTSSRSSVLIWVKEGKKYCPECRGSSGIAKTKEYYNKFLPEEYKVLGVLSEQGNTKVVVVHNVCGKEYVYSSRHIINPDREYLYCSICEGIGPYDSKQEKLVVEHLLKEYPALDILTHVKYKELVPTNRRYILDVFIPELNLAIEITTKGNGFPQYFQNLSKKLELLREHGYTCEIVFSTSQADDIVRSLLKGKEKN